MTQNESKMAAQRVWVVLCTSFVTLLFVPHQLPPDVISLGEHTAFPPGLSG